VSGPVGPGGGVASCWACLHSVTREWSRVHGRGGRHGGHVFTARVALLFAQPLLSHCEWGLPRPRRAISGRLPCGVRTMGTNGEETVHETVFDSPHSMTLPSARTPLRAKTLHLTRRVALYSPSTASQQRTTTLPNLDMHAFIKFAKSSLQCSRGILGSTSDCLPAEVGGV
jgi:hypothetical protein